MFDPHARDASPVDKTIVVNGGRRPGGSGWLVAGILVVALVIGAFFLFGDGLFDGGGAGSTTGGGDTKITVNTPDINVPDVDIEAPAVPSNGSSGASAPVN